MPTVDRAFEMAREIDRLTMRERVADALMQGADAAALVALIERDMRAMVAAEVEMYTGEMDRKVIADWIYANGT